MIRVFIILAMLTLNAGTVQAAMITPTKPLAGAATMQSINALIAQNANDPMPVRIDRMSAAFLGAPYKADFFGEGSTGKYDKDPVFRFDGFDCTTYIETVCALAMARNFKDFKRLIIRMRYKNGKVAFVSRNHFISMDWVPENVRQGFVKDITANVAGKYGVNKAAAIIDKNTWYRKLPTSRLSPAPTTSTAQASLLNALHVEGKNFKPGRASLPYIGLDVLFMNSKPNSTIFDAIPSGSIINIVRPNWNLAKSIGTNINVSHQGFAIRTPNGTLLFRHAKAGKTRQVTEEPLETYLRPFINSKTIKGVNILMPQNVIIQ
ncbi:N-acetylmuramoyl-L-alanine amidase-like domain-containing protein [Desulfovibrio inopinatus]|uniref:N-acetylmuramoyl-L-alanine amidase-like domain-containing protein n=1 Tax=Desulfovibrio inopinatus TaxID=102109 RepID=UPI000408501A|nr:N-acetylmuramoyl-L-alanine amidase-like domain-containing protein [Desulfovibrio inopinatus]